MRVLRRGYALAVLASALLAVVPARAESVDAGHASAVAPPVVAVLLHSPPALVVALMDAVAMTPDAALRAAIAGDANAAGPNDVPGLCSTAGVAPPSLYRKCNTPPNVDPLSARGAPWRLPANGFTAGMTPALK